MASNRYSRQQAICGLILTVVLTVSGLFGYKADYFQWFDHLIYDLHFKLRGRSSVSSQIVLVLMDEQSALDLQRKRGAWPRRPLAAALDNLCQAKAEIVGLDMSLDFPDQDPSIDRQVAEAIYNCNNVVLGRILAVEGVDDKVALDLFQEGMIGDGFIDVAPDEDEVLRRIRFLNAKPLADGSLMLLPSFALEIVRTYLNLNFDFDFSAKDFFLLGNREGGQLKLPYPELLVNYRGDFHDFPIISYSDVVRGQFAQELVEGKIVLIGSSLLLDDDFFTTPFSRFQKLAADYSAKFGSIVKLQQMQKDLGVSCHAYAIHTMLEKDFIRMVEPLKLWVLLLCMAVVGFVFYLPSVQWAVGGGVLAIGLAGMAAAAHYFFRQNVWLEVAAPSLLFCSQFIAGLFVQRYFEKKHAERVTGLFGKYVSPAVVQQLITDDLANTLAGHRQVVTIFFSDIRGFTTLSEQLGAVETGRLLNTYFGAMIPIIFDHQGTLDKLIGDAIMAFYGAPIIYEDHPRKAASTSLLMLEKLQQLKEMNIIGMDRIEIGIGLNTGDVTIGNLGSEAFMDYTVISDAVNLASRLESLNKMYKTRIIVSEFTAKLLGDDFLVRELDNVAVKGKDKAVTIYELAGWNDRVSSQKKEALALFGNGLDLFRQQQFNEAEKVFNRVLIQLPEDGPSALYIERIATFRKFPPPPDWQGVTKLYTK